MGNRRRIGVLSDTHGFFDAQLKKIFADTDQLIHAGDIGPDTIVERLQEIAPVIAVSGNCDSFLPYPVHHRFSACGFQIHLQHIVTPGRTDSIPEPTDLVVFGHTHRQYSARFGGIHYLNPGYSGAPKRGTTRSVALLSLEQGKSIELEFISLG